MLFLDILLGVVLHHSCGLGVSSTGLQDKRTEFLVDSRNVILNRWVISSNGEGSKGSLWSWQKAEGVHCETSTNI